MYAYFLSICFFMIYVGRQMSSEIDVGGYWLAVTYGHQSPNESQCGASL